MGLVGIKWLVAQSATNPFNSWDKFMILHTHNPFSSWDKFMILHTLILRLDDDLAFIGIILDIVIANIIRDVKIK